MKIAYKRRTIVAKSHRLKPHGWIPEARVLHFIGGEQCKEYEHLLLGEYPRSSQVLADHASIQMAMDWIDGRCFLQTSS